MSSQVDKDSAAISGDVEGFNSAIFLSRHRPHRQQPDEKNKYALGPTARRSLRQRTTSELQDVICFFVLIKVANMLVENPTLRWVGSTLAT